MLLLYERKKTKRLERNHPQLFQVRLNDATTTLPEFPSADVQLCWGEPSFYTTLPRGCPRRREKISRSLPGAAAISYRRWDKIPARFISAAPARTRTAFLRLAARPVLVQAPCKGSKLILNIPDEVKFCSSGPSCTHLPGWQAENNRTFTVQ